MRRSRPVRPLGWSMLLAAMASTKRSAGSPWGAVGPRGHHPTEPRTRCSDKGRTPGPRLSVVVPGAGRLRSTHVAVLGPQGRYGCTPQGPRSRAWDNDGYAYTSQPAGPRRIIIGWMQEAATDDGLRVATARLPGFSSLPGAEASSSLRSSSTRSPAPAGSTCWPPLVGSRSPLSPPETIDANADVGGRPTGQPEGSTQALEHRRDARDQRPLQLPGCRPSTPPAMRSLARRAGVAMGCSVAFGELVGDGVGRVAVQRVSGAVVAPRGLWVRVAGEVLHVA